jgi:hypothetical protein
MSRLYHLTPSKAKSIGLIDEPVSMAVRRFVGMGSGRSLHALLWHVRDVVIDDLEPLELVPDSHLDIVGQQPSIPCYQKRRWSWRSVSGWVSVSWARCPAV